MWQNNSHREAGALCEAQVCQHGLVVAVHERLVAAAETAQRHNLAKSPLAAAQAVLLAQFYTFAIGLNHIHHAAFALFRRLHALALACQQALYDQLPWRLDLNHSEHRF